jgi:hypothetical protein
MKVRFSLASRLSFLQGGTAEHHGSPQHAPWSSTAPVTPIVISGCLLVSTDGWPLA